MQMKRETAPRYSIVRKDRMSNKGRGLAFLIHNSIQYSVAPLPPPTAHDNVMESQAVNIVSGLTNVLLLNIYIPPTTSSPSGYSANIEHLFTAHDSIIMGDFNAHHPLWHCTLEENQRGTNLADQINESNYGVLNEDFPTRITPTVSSTY